MSSTRRTRREFERYRLILLEDASVALPTTEDEVLVRPIFNVSYRGLGFHPQSGDDVKIPQQISLQGSLRLRKDVIPVQMEILYVRKELAGARIQPENPSDIHRIIRFISPLEAGASLRPVKSDVIRQPARGRRVAWYVGKNNTELLVWRNLAGELLDFRLVYQLWAVAGDLTAGTLATADLNPVEFGYLPIHQPWPEEAAHWHSAPKREALQGALEVLSQASGLTPIDQEEISAWILGAMPS